jgi:hypothetical protein
VHRLCIASIPMLLLLVACTHERSASRPLAPEAATAASAPAPSLNNSVPSSAPEAPTLDAPPVAAPPVNPPETSPSPEAAAAPPQSKAGSQAGAAGSSPSLRKPSQPGVAPTSAPAEAIQALSPAAAAVPPRTATAATPALDLTALEQRLRDTRAIGVFTKLSLKNQVDDLLAQFRSFYNGGSKVTLAELRQKFELLLLKVVTVLQDDDPSLAAAVSSSREAIWGVLSDPKKLANM